ncbi:hypothetical protein [Paenarthrobacter aurescens]|uniref:Uncharacterized protein n=1 Tax=Paenarthrobacter aurescens TaxID=43663 RepID=A0A4Y3NKV8_PAEAU|nr:hypothetical protein [Paenarthrobacter aurescens]MDO6142543.1 hypothetical protein [Paenarthrobacter aurescens]MDO6146390.1 hypothetical protein [Paenarthrobacter aurescens]MDO6157635.1 hypothetical protein [Paenarthrobacter aurescens]MDO6161620.1 hypothetical protein [Paenarthrobacter aurescens]GEB21095.1 hypothetical protein AAU01_38500 [Paenarthrobacter aurescens]
MSVHIWYLVDLSASSAEADSAVHRLQEWLVTTGWVGAERESDWVEGLCLTPGPRALERGLAKETSNLTLIHDRDGYSMGENFAPPSCPACGETLDEDILFDAYSDWAATDWTLGTQPSVSCDACGEEKPVVDFADEHSRVAHGNLAIALYAWDHEELFAAVEENFPGHWRTIYSHT